MVKNLLLSVLSVIPPKYITNRAVLLVRSAVIPVARNLCRRKFDSYSGINLCAEYTGIVIRR